MLTSLASPGPAAAQAEDAQALVAQLEAETAANEAAAAESRRKLELARIAAAEATIRQYRALAAKAAEAEALLERVKAGDTPGRSPSPSGAVQEVTKRTTTETEGKRTTEETTARSYKQEDLRDLDDDKQKFGGIEFGVGIAFSYDLGENDRIKEAEVVNGIVRVTDRENVRARIILESHYFFTPSRGALGDSLLGLTNEPGDKGRKEWGIGPFIALQPGTDDVIDAIGAGLMVGFRRPNSETQSFNIGVGVLYDLNTRLLGEGLRANEPLPEGETTVRYIEEEQAGLLVLSSYSF